LSSHLSVRPPKPASSVVAPKLRDAHPCFFEGFETFPERGSIRDHVRVGLRIVGFEPTEVVILRNDISLMRL
jgi:hypothetical protein